MKKPIVSFRIVRDAVGQYFVVSEDGVYATCWRYDYRAAKLDLAKQRAQLHGRVL